MIGATRLGDNRPQLTSLVCFINYHLCNAVAHHDFPVDPMPIKTQRCRNTNFFAAALCLLFLPCAHFRLLVAQEPLPESVRTALAERFQGQPLRWGGDAEGGAPYEFLDPQDPEKVIGFEVDLMESLAKALGKQLGIPVQAQFVQSEWTTLPNSMSRGDFDCILSGQELTAANLKQMRFSRPYCIFAEQLVVRQDETRITNLNDCRDKLVGTLSRSAAERILQEEGIPVNSYSTQTEPYQDLVVGRVDAVLLDDIIANYYAKPNPQLKFVGELVGESAYGIGMRLEDEHLHLGMDAALSELIVNGELARILKKWSLHSEQQRNLVRWESRAAELVGLDFKEDGRIDDSQGDETKVVPGTGQNWTFSRYAPLLLKAAAMTVLLTLCSMAAAMLVGLVVSVCRLYGVAPLRLLALGYVELFRGIPVLLVLYFLYFGLTAYGIKLDAFSAAILAFALNYGAYEAEVYRTSISAVPKGQWEAGRALALNELTIFRRIIFPQAMRTALGPITNDFVALFKDTSLVSVVAINELTKEYQVLSRSSLKYAELGLLTAILYLAMSVPLGYLSRWLEHRFTPGKS